MYKLKIKSIEPDRNQANDTAFLDVCFEIIKVEGTERTVVDTRKQGFDTTISKEDLVAELEKVVATYALEQEQKVVQADLDAAEKNIQDLKADLVGSEI